MSDTDKPNMAENAALRQQLSQAETRVAELERQLKQLSELSKFTRCNRLTHVVGAWTGECERCQIDECESRVAIIEAALETEKTMHAAWEKRAYEAETENERLRSRLAPCGDGDAEGRGVMLFPLVRQDYSKIYSEKLIGYRVVNHCNNVLAYPDHWPRYYNGCNEPCDMLQGPCACGAWHDLNEWSIQTQGAGP